MNLFDISEPIPRISKELIPWLVKQQKEIIEGGQIWSKEDNKMVHDGWGLEAAQHDVKSGKSKLAAKNSSDMEAILKIRLGYAQTRVEYYEWRLKMNQKIVELSR